MSRNEKRFIRTKENFVCEQCGVEVLGNGYTNHCPVCLWSKHVDIFPGDRLSTCLGMMMPTSIFLNHGVYTVEHTCVLCGHKKCNVTSKLDSFETILHLSKQIAEK